VDIVGRHSFTVDGKTGRTLGSPLGQQQLSSSLIKLTQTWRENTRYIQPNHTSGESASDTWVIPLLQAGRLNITQEHDFVDSLLKAVAPHDRVNLSISSAYLNFPRSYITGFLNSKARIQFITASPQANGFFNSKGLSRHVPSVYTYLERRLWKAAKAVGRLDHMRFWEYIRPGGWTFHSKGIWYSVSDGLPEMTVIGSSNFGRRSAQRDLESQLVLVSSNLKLRNRLDQVRFTLYLCIFII
jgi:CDP-diacylglycerol--glycerol-3-phosphate 3-phosphatidyltransferase